MILYLQRSQGGNKMELSFNSSSIFTRQPDKGKDSGGGSSSFCCSESGGISNCTPPSHRRLIKCFKIIKTFKVAIKVNVASDLHMSFCVCARLHFLAWTHFLLILLSGGHFSRSSQRYTTFWRVSLGWGVVKAVTSVRLDSVCVLILIRSDVSFIKQFQCWLMCRIKFQTHT